MKTSKMLHLSKKHLSLKTREMMQENPLQFLLTNVYKKYDGWFIEINPKCFDEELFCSHYPADLKAVISFAFHAECDMLRIDDTTEPIICLPSYEYRFNVPVAGGNPGETCTMEDVWCGNSKLASNRLSKM